MGNSSPEYMRAWRQANQEKSRLYRAANKEKRAAQFREWSEKNREQKRSSHKLWRDAHKDRVSAKNRNWYEKNKERAKLKQGEYRAGNRALMNALSAMKRARKKLATPKWLSSEHKLQINRTYRHAALLTETTGVQHHVDHIYPLTGKTVSGLHVPWNLQVLTAAENIRKSNSIVAEEAAEVIRAFMEAEAMSRGHQSKATE